MKTPLLPAVEALKELARKQAAERDRERIEIGFIYDILPAQLSEEQKKESEKKQMTTGFDVEYLGGYPQWLTPCKVNFSIENTSILLRKGSETFKIPKEDIVAISNEKSGHRSVGKTAAGALVGGVLTGGIGLIVGGALGARKKDTSEVFVTYKYNGAELTLNLKPGKNTDKVYAWINSVFA